MNSTVSPQSITEEVSNSILHGIGIIISIVFLVILIIKSLNSHSTSLLITTIIFSVSLILLFLMSVLHHALTPPKAKRVFLILDYSAIYIVIAATFTPFLAAILGLNSITNIILLIAVWMLAVTGIILSAIFSKKIKKIAPFLYIAIGWLAIFIIQPIYQKEGLLVPLLLVAGGLTYTLGSYFYLNDHRKYFHTIWHVFVIIGSLCHALSLYFS